jgi:DNA-binding response OmpR family regulator
MLSPHTILVVDDEPDARQVLKIALQRMSYIVLQAPDGATTIKEARRRRPSLILLDLMMPELDGFDVCRILKNDPTTATIPIIIITARSDEMDRVIALELGAEDYLTKPVSFRELTLRMQKILRSAPDSRDAGAVTVICEDLHVDEARHLVVAASKIVDLTAAEFRILIRLGRDRDTVVSRADLLRDLRSFCDAEGIRTIDTHIVRLRRKLGAAGRRVQTVRGFGYRLDSQPPRVART